MCLKNHVLVLNRLIYYELINFKEHLPLVVFFHDALGSVAQWKNFPLKLSQKLKLPCLVYDRHGYGQSESSPLGKRTHKYLANEAEICFRELLRALNINVPLILIGHSDGGTIALIAGSQLKEKVAGIVSIAGHVFLEEEATIGIEKMIELYQNNSQGIRDKLMTFHGEKTDMLFESWYSIWLSQEYKNWNVMEKLKDITAPLLVIQGSDDEYGTIDHPIIIKENTSGISEFWIAQDCGHLPHKQIPDEIIAKITAFYDTNISHNLIRKTDGK